MPKPLRIGVATHSQPDLRSPYFFACLAGLRGVFGINSLQINPQDSPVDGWILLAPSEEQIYEARKAGVPLVLVNGWAADVPSVDLDNAGAARAVTSHLAERGHRRIGFIAGKRETSNARDREEGYRRTLEKFSIPWDPALVAEGRFEREEGARAMRKLLELPSPPTAVFAANDHMALGAWEVLKEKDIPVPAGVALAGFDDIPEAERARLTSVRQPLSEMAKQAGVWLRDWIRTDRRPERDYTLFPGELMIRISSVASPRV